MCGESTLAFGKASQFDCNTRRARQWHQPGSLAINRHSEDNNTVDESDAAWPCGL